MISEWGVPAVSATGCFKNTYKVGHLRKKSPPNNNWDRSMTCPVKSVNWWDLETSYKDIINLIIP